jgi:hypothetical protein
MIKLYVDSQRFVIFLIPVLSAPYQNRSIWNKRNLDLRGYLPIWSTYIFQIYCLQFHTTHCGCSYIADMKLLLSWRRICCIHNYPSIQHDLSSRKGVVKQKNLSIIRTNIQLFLLIKI